MMLQRWKHTASLFSVINIPPSYTGNKYDYVRQFDPKQHRAVENPSRKDEIANSPEWRPYYILYKRYEEGLSIQELSDLLAISPRQLRRGPSPCFSKLSPKSCWNRCYASPTTSEDKVANQEALKSFEIHNEIIDPLETTRGVYNLLKRRFAEKKGRGDLRHAIRATAGDH